MKNLHIFLRSIALSGIMLMMHACGSNTTTTTPDESTSTENVVIDTKVHSNSKGVGRFTDVKLEAIDPAKVEIGKAIFEAKCTTCHKMTADKFVGPGMQGITERRTPEWILNMITNPDEMVKKDPVAKKLLEEILSPMAFQDVTDDDARNILEYLRQNDKK